MKPSRISFPPLSQAECMSLLGFLGPCASFQCESTLSGPAEGPPSKENYLFPFRNVTNATGVAATSAAAAMGPAW